MRFLAMTLLALAGLAALDVPASRVQAQDYPWCIVYNGPEADGGEHCMFISYQQCLMTATPGSGATCVRNPRIRN
jgi:hypothetical protein